MVFRDRFDVSARVALLAATSITPLSLLVVLFSVPFDIIGKVLVVSLGGLAQFVVSYVSLYRPVSELRTDIRQELMQILLDELRRDYRNSFATDAELRANVMMLNKRFSEGLLPHRQEHFQIEYHSGDYAMSELDRRYSPGEGCWGQAYTRENPTYYDEQQNPHPAREMTATQRRVTDHVTSAVSVPIYRPGAVGEEVIGILNLDSPDSIDLTNFNEGDAHRFLMNYAGLAGHVLI